MKTIKHLVIPGGGPSGLQAIGILQCLEEKGVWNIENIESIYATSAGTLIAVMLAMKFHWDYITDYIIKRPWNKFVQFDLMLLIESLNSRGIFDKTLMVNFLKPFFLAKGMDMDISLFDFEKQTNIALHFFTFELTEFDVVELSGQTTPNIKVMDAVYMSSAIPVLFKPFLSKGKCYLDGGVACNNPISYALQRFPDHASIFNISHDYGDKNDGSSFSSKLGYDDDDDDDDKKENVKKDGNKTRMSMMEYFFYFIMTFIQRTGNLLKRMRGSAAADDACVYQYIIYKARRLNLEDIHDVFTSESKRREFIDYGKEVATKWFDESSFSSASLSSSTSSSDK